MASKRFENMYFVQYHKAKATEGTNVNIRIVERGGNFMCKCTDTDKSCLFIDADSFSERRDKDWIVGITYENAARVVKAIHREVAKGKMTIG